jgi:hypothetical protein
MLGQPLFAFIFSYSSKYAYVGCLKNLGSNISLIAFTKHYK